MYFYAGRKVTYDDDEEDIGELWKSDGTKAGTVKVTDAKITRMTAAGDDLYFIDGEGDLWTSDGTAKGTRRLMQPAAPFGQFIPTSRGMYFTLETDHPGDTLTDIDLYFTDGTPTGTRHLGQFLEDLVGYSSRRDDPFEDNDGNLFFIANTEEYGPELWTSDGTPQGTRLVRDIRKGTESSNPSSLITHDGLAYFFANDGKNGPKLWRSNGKPNGTRIVKNFSLDDDLKYSPHLALASLAGGIVYTKYSNSYEIWFGDEKDGFRSLGKSSVAPRSPLAWAHHDGKFLFAAHHPIYHTELWQADL